MASRTREVTEKSLDEAADRLRSGQLVAFPTETVYGLGACALDPEAVARIYAAKRRPRTNPTIVHVHSAQEAKGVTKGWSERCDLATEHFWPGPLTIVTQRSSDLPLITTGGLETVALRSPDHHVALGLLDRLGQPIAAPSANKSGHVSPTLAQHVADDFAEEDILILDGGPTVLGLESTVLDLTGPDDKPATILRSGAILASELEVVLGPVDTHDAHQQGKSPGTQLSHYAPQVPLELVNGDELASYLSRSKVSLAVLAFQGMDVKPPHVLLVMPNDPKGYAHHLYAQLRAGEAYGGIVVVRPPHGPQWEAIHDRLIRAATQ